jgi:hypothetical protein
MTKHRDPLDAYAEDVEVLTPEEADEPDVLIDPEAVVKARGEDVQRAIPGHDTKEAVLSRVRKFVSKRMEDMSMKFPLPPYDEILHRDEYWVLLNDCLEIVERYRQGGFDANEAHTSTDLTRLLGNLTYLSGMVGYLNASVNHADSKRKIARSKAYIFAKEARDKEGLHLTDTDAAEFARDFTEDLDENKQYLHLMARTINGAFYAIRSFAEELSRIAHRTQKTEQRAAEHG